jgi:hypothetical protein
MSLFKNPASGSPAAPEPPKPPEGGLPVALIDPSKRYDLYCSIPSEDRLYEDVKIIGIRTFEPKKHEFAPALLGGYLEIEARSGARMMIPHLRIHMICEHGAEPSYKVLRARKAVPDE